MSCLCSHGLIRPQNRASNKSLAFVAHDIEGNVVKKALVIASQEKTYSHVLEDTHLLICERLQRKVFWYLLLRYFSKCLMDPRRRMGGFLYYLKFLNPAFST